MKSVSLQLKKRSPLTIFIYLLIIAVGRTLLETFLSSSQETFYFLSLNIEFLISSLLFLTLLILAKFFFSELPFERSKRHFLAVFWIFLLTPLFAELYTSFAPEITFLENNLEFIIFAALITLYFVNRVEYERDSKIYLSYLYTGLGFFLSLALLTLGIINQMELLSIIFSSQSTTFFGITLIVLLLELTLGFSITVYIYDTEAFRSLLKSIKPMRTLHFVGLTVIGFLLAYSIEGEIFLSDISIILPILCMVLMWQFSTMINDYYDIDTDQLVHPNRPLVREKMDTATFKEIGVVSGFLSLLLSLLFSLELFLLNLVFFLAGIAYSVPPITLKNRIYGHICVGYASVTAFLFGLYGTFSLTNVDLFLIETGSRIAFFPDIFTFSVIIFVVFSISPLINAIDDFEGDKKAGVRNIYTVYGFETGKKIVSILIIFLFLSPIMIFNSRLDLIIIVPASVISSIVFYKFENYKFVLGLYFLILVYILIKFLVI